MSIVIMLMIAAWMATLSTFCIHGLRESGKLLRLRENIAAGGIVRSSKFRHRVRRPDSVPVSEPGFCSDQRTRSVQSHGRF